MGNFNLYSIITIILIFVNTFIKKFADTQLKNVSAIYSLSEFPETLVSHFNELFRLNFGFLFKGLGYEIL